MLCLLALSGGQGAWSVGRRRFLQHMQHARISHLKLVTYLVISALMNLFAAANHNVAIYKYGQ